MNRSFTEYPVIPEKIVVHLGPPSSNARNITVSFPDYIKNVASSEIYPTWNEEAIRANVLAQISFALNRFYTEYYRSRGYDFDITNSTAVDQSYVEGREIFDNISRIVDETFNNYIARQSSIAPLFASYCNGTTTTCPGLSQWGSEALAAEGLDALSILKRYYGDNIEIRSAGIENVSPSLPPVPLSIGSVGNSVRLLALRLNRISTNYPSIPKIYPIDGIFDSKVEDAVREFQRIFNLKVDGIVGKATWYKIIYVYNAVKKLSETVSEDLYFSEVEQPFVRELKLGDEGNGVDIIQYYLELISYFVDTIPFPPLNNVFDERTENSVRAFQREYSLPETGIVDPETWRSLYRVYSSFLDSVPDRVFGELARPFPGIVLREGSEGNDVLNFQQYLKEVNSSLSIYPEPPLSAYFGPQTTEALKAYQRFANLPSNGIVTPIVWDSVADTYNSLVGGFYGTL